MEEVINWRDPSETSPSVAIRISAHGKDGGLYILGKGRSDLEGNERLYWNRLGDGLEMQPLDREVPSTRRGSGDPRVDAIRVLKVEQDGFDEFKDFVTELITQAGGTSLGRDKGIAFVNLEASFFARHPSDPNRSAISTRTIEIYLNLPEIRDLLSECLKSMTSTYNMFSRLESQEYIPQPEGGVDIVTKVRGLKGVDI